MVPFAFDELVATGQFLMRSYKRGENVWATFMFGGSDEPGPQERIPAKPATLGQGFAGVNYPISLIASAILGVMVMVSPAVLQFGVLGANSQHLVGALVVTAAVTAMAEPCRAARLLNVLLGIWLVVSPFILTGNSSAAMLGDLAAGAALILLSLRKGKIEERYGGWDRCII
jgi:hypothetical protein